MGGVAPLREGVLMATMLLPSPFVIRSSSTTSALALREDAAINPDEAELGCSWRGIWEHRAFSLL